MNYSIFRFTLNMHNHRSQASVKVFKGDTAVKLIITLTDGGNIYKIGRGCMATLTGTKADGSKLKHDCIIEGDVIIYIFDEETTDCSGLAICEITLYDENGRVITAPHFTIDVAEKEVEGSEPISEYSSAAITAVMGAAAGEYARQEAELARQANEEQRQESYNNAETVANEANEIAESAKNVANEAKTSTENNAEKIKENYDIFANASFSYDRTTGQLIYTFKNEDGVDENRTVVLPFEKSIVSIRSSREGCDPDYDESRSDLLSLTLDLANGEEVIIPLNDIETDFVEAYKIMDSHKDLLNGLNKETYYLGEEVNKFNQKTEKRLEQLESATLQFTEDSSIAYMKTVPANYAKYALVSMVGGMTYKTDEGLRDVLVSHLYSEGANLLPLDYKEAVGHTAIYDECAVKVLEDGGISIVGKSSFDISYTICVFDNDTIKSFEQGKQYCVSGSSSGVTVAVYITPTEGDVQSTNWIYSTDGANGVQTLPEGYKPYKIVLHIPTSETALNTVVYPMLNRGPIPLPHARGGVGHVDALSIPIDNMTDNDGNAVEGIGRGVNEEYYNYIDFERKVFVQQTYRLVLDGVSYNKKVTSFSRNRGYVALPYAPKNKASALINSHFVYKSSLSNGVSQLSSPNLIMQKTELTTVDAWNDWLKEQYDNENPVTIEYALATPLEYDISKFLNNFDNFIKIDVNGDGVIRAENPYELEAPTTISYVSQKGSS